MKNNFFVNNLLYEKKRVLEVLDNINNLLGIYGYVEEVEFEEEIVVKEKEPEVIAPVDGATANTVTVTAKVRPMKVTKEPKAKAEEKKLPSPAVTEKREFLLNLIKEHDMYFTVNDIVELYMAVKGESQVNENFARNSIYKLCNDGVLKRLPNITPYTYGLKEWFRPNGSLMDEHKFNNKK